LRLAKERPDESILVNLSGRGDKDLDFVINSYGAGE
jgi:Tryptophan synthase beta chain